MFNRDHVLLECDTEFEHYQVVDMYFEGRKARILFSGKRDAAFSGMPLDDNHDLLFDYIQRMYEFVCTVRPKRMLLIGGGTYTLPTALIQTLDDITIDCVEIDPQLEVIAQEFFNYTPDDRIVLHHTDGKSYLENTKETYDVIIVDAFSHLKIPPSLADSYFASLIDSHLTDTGAMAMNIVSSYQGKQSTALRQMYHVYAPQFNHVNVHQADYDVSLWTSQNFILVAEKSDSIVGRAMRYPALQPPAQL